MLVRPPTRFVKVARRCLSGDEQFPMLASAAREFKVFSLAVSTKLLVEAEPARQRTPPSHAATLKSVHWE